MDGFRSIAFQWIFYPGLIFLAFFFLRNHVSPHPYINYKISDSPIHMVLVLALFFAVFIFHFSVIVLLSHWLHVYVNFSMDWIGILVLVALIGPIALHFVSIRTTKFETFTYLSLSILLIMGISLYITHFDAEVNLGRIAWTRFLDGVAISMFLPAGVRLLVLSCFPNRDYWAIGLFTLSKSLGSFFGVALTALVWEKRDAFFHSRLGGGLTEFSQNTKAVWNILNVFKLKAPQKLASLNDALERQSRALSLNDCFYGIFWVLTILFAIYLLYVLFFRRQEITE